MLLSIDIQSATSTIQTLPIEVSVSLGTIVEVSSTPKTTAERIVFWARTYGADANEMVDILLCESGLRQTKNGITVRGALDEIGIAQFRPATFAGFSKKYGWKLDIYSEDDQIRLMAKMFADGYQFHWSCYNQMKTTALSKR